MSPQQYNTSVGSLVSYKVCNVSQTTFVYEVHIPAEAKKEEDNAKATKEQDVSMYCS